MAVNLSGIRRNFKNVAHNYTDAQVCDAKVIIIKIFEGFYNCCYIIFVIVVTVSREILSNSKISIKG